MVDLISRRPLGLLQDAFLQKWPLVIDNSDRVICFQAMFLEGVTGKIHCTTPEGTIYIEDNVNDASLEFFILVTLLLPTLLYFGLIFFMASLLEG